MTTQRNTTILVECVTNIYSEILVQGSRDLAPDCAAITTLMFVVFFLYKTLKASRTELGATVRSLDVPTTCFLVL